MAAKEDEEQDKLGPGAAIAAAILGMGSAIGGMIPSLLKGPQTGYLKRVQKSGGAGAALARQTGSEAARRVLGASTAQPSSGRGGNLREGLRAADQLTQRGAQQAGVIGAKEAMAATQMLRQNQFAQRNAARQFGAGIGGGLAATIAQFAAASDQGPSPQEVNPSPADVLRAQSPQDEVTGLTSLPPKFSLGQPDLGLQAPPDVAPVGLQQGMQRQAPQVQGPQAAPPPGPSRPLQQPLQSPSVGTTYGPPQMPTPEERATRKVGEIAQMGYDKQTAAKIVELTASVPGDVGSVSDVTMPPPMTEPGAVEEWIYQQALNYDPRIGQGLAPEEAAKMLSQYGFPVDWARLGIGEPLPAQWVGRKPQPKQYEPPPMARDIYSGRKPMKQGQ